MEQAARDLRRLGTEIVAWWIEEAGEAAFARQPLATEAVDVTARDLVSHRELLELLDLDAGELPLIDPWGRPYEIRIAMPQGSDLGGIILRTAGADGKFESNTYTTGPIADDPSADLVWVDGFFVRWPQPR